MVVDMVMEKDNINPCKNKDNLMERAARGFVQLPQNSKSFIMGYMAAVQQFHRELDEPKKPA